MRTISRVSPPGTWMQSPPRGAGAGSRCFLARGSRRVRVRGSVPCLAESGSRRAGMHAMGRCAEGIQRGDPGSGLRCAPPPVQGAGLRTARWRACMCLSSESRPRPAGTRVRPALRHGRTLRPSPSQPACQRALSGTGPGRWGADRGRPPRHARSAPWGHAGPCKSYPSGCPAPGRAMPAWGAEIGAAGPGTAWAACPRRYPPRWQAAQAAHAA